MPEPVELLERRIDALRAQVRQALVAGDRELARSRRRELRTAESDWEDALTGLEVQPPDDAGGRPAPPGGLSIPLREQVHHALTLLTVPAGPKLISAVHEAFFSGAILTARLTSLRRDEERSFRAAPFARPYYLCAVLTADLLGPARGLLAVSTWPMERRVIGSLSSRVYFLTAAIRVAESVQRLPEPDPAATRLLWRFAANIPGGTGSGSAERGVAGRAGSRGTRLADPQLVARAAETELEIHADADSATRGAAAKRARDQLDDAGQLFGSRLRTISEQHRSTA